MLSSAERIGKRFQELVKRAEFSTGTHVNNLTDVAGQVKALERKVRELPLADEILGKASVRPFCSG